MRWIVSQRCGLFSEYVKRVFLDRTKTVTVVFSLAVLYKFLFFSWNGLTAILFSVVCAYATVWMYRSSVKYGIESSLDFLLMFPLHVLSSVIDGGKKTIESDDELSQLEYQLISVFSETLDRYMNELYYGEIVELSKKKDGLHVTVTLAYGIVIPFRDYVKKATIDVYVYPSHVAVTTLTSVLYEVILSTHAVYDYERYLAHLERYTSLRDVYSRLALRKDCYFFNKTQLLEANETVQWS